MILSSKEDIRAAIRRRGAQIAAEISDKELFLSEQMRSYAEHLADFILRNHRLYSLEIAYTKKGAVAYTDGKKIYWNTGNSLAAHPKLLESRFKVNMGILFHEVAHKLFIDFPTSKKAIASIENGTLFGNFPQSPTPEQSQAYQEILDVLQQGYGSAVASVYAKMDNIICDGHDEAAMKRCFPGIIADSINAAGAVQMELTPPLSDLIESRTPSFGIYQNLILEYAKCGQYVVGTASKETDAYLAGMAQIEPVIDAALLTDDYAARWDYLNLLVLFLWKTIREQFPKNPQNQQQGTQGNQGQQNSQSGQGSESGGAGTQSPNTPPSPADVKAALEKIAEQAREQANAAPAPINGTESAVSAASLGKALPDANGTLSSLLSAIANGKAEKQIQKELDKQQMDAIRNMNVPLCHAGVTQETIRHPRAGSQGDYAELYTPLAPIVRNLSNEMLALLREFNEEAIQHHRRYGTIVEATESYRPDNAFFAKKKLPDDLPNMALAVLIDQSGSMSGSKLHAAKQAAILLERFAENIGIPCMIAGHAAHSGHTELRIYTDFVSANPGKDRLTLPRISAFGCNRDGLAIRICAELLSKRTEDIRLMIVISDGAPNDSGYRGKEAQMDVSDTVKEFRRKGLLIYGAAIDDDREVIEKMYGKGFLSISDLRSLPRALVRVVRQQIL